MQAVYLTGPTVYLRAMVEDDKHHAAAWFDNPFPVNAARAEAFLKEKLQGDPWDARWHLLAIVRRSDDTVVGSCRIRFEKLAAHLRFGMAPWLDDADLLRAEALGLVVPWLRDEHEVLVITLEIAADEQQTLAAAESVGMRPVVRLREAVARPGHRVDLLTYQAVAPDVEVEHA